MKRSMSGFTIIEVSLVLAATAMMLTVAAVALKGQNTSTAFQQSLRDLENKIQNTTKDVSNSLFPNAPLYSCSLVADSSGVLRATLTRTSRQYIGSNQDCLFLGKALQVVKGQGTVHIYTVLGGRTYQSGGETLQAATFAQTNPIPALNSSTNTDLTESYKPSAGGINLLSAHYDGSTTTETDMAGFYNDLVGAGGSNQQLLTKAYGLTTNASMPKTSVTNCIEETGCQVFPMRHWLLCYEDAGKKQTAVLDVVASTAGITTKITIKTCS